MSGNKTIVFLNHWGENLGGAEYSLIDLILKASESYNCILITSESGKLTNKLNQHNIETITVQANKKIALYKRDNINPFKFFNTLYIIPYLFKVNKVIRKINPDLIHANIPKSHILLLLLYMIGLKTPGIIHMREIFKNPLITFLYTFLYNNKAKVISISKAVESNLPVKLKKNSKVIYNGIKIPESLSKKANKHKINLVYIGRIVPWKGCDILILILKRVIELDPHVEYELNLFGDTIYWDKSYRVILKNFINSLDLSNVCFINNSTPDISLVLNQSDIFINASSEEPFGRVLAEASAHALPVITFKSGGAQEIITNDTGILIKDNCIDDFVKAIIELSNNKIKSLELGKNGRKRAVKLFNKDLQLQKTLSFIDQILD